MKGYHIIITKFLELSQTSLSILLVYLYRDHLSTKVFGRNSTILMDIKMYFQQFLRKLKGKKNSHTRVSVHLWCESKLGVIQTCIIIYSH